MDIADFYARASYDILRNIASGMSNIARQKTQIRQLLAIARIKKGNKEILQKAFKQVPVQLNKQLMEEVKKEFEKLGEQWSEKYEMQMFKKPLQELENQIFKETINRLNTVNTVMQINADKLTDSAYELLNNERYRILSTGTAEVATGVSTYQEALENTIRRLSESNITGFMDKSGRNWSAESYVSMDIATTLHNSHNQAAKTMAEQVGANVIYVTTHADSRPKCEPYQGKYYSTDGTYGTIRDINGNPHEYEPLENTTYGEPAGLFGINCKHDRIPVLDGLFRDRSKEEVKSTQEGYEATQTARAMEREIRELKKREGILRAGNQDTGNLQIKIDNKIELYYRYCESQGIRERDDRLQIY